MNRPVRDLVVPIVLALISALTLWRAFAVGPLITGLTGGVVAGAVAGWLMARPWPSVGGIVGRMVSATAVLAAGLVIVTREPTIFGRVAEQVSTFLSIGLPADGLDDLEVVPYVLVALAVLGTVWAAARGRHLVSILVPVLGFVTGSLLAAPVGVPWLVPIAFMVVMATELLVVSRMHFSELEPLVGTSTAIRRNLQWWRPAVIGLPAMLLGVVALTIPLPGAFDVRQFVSADVVQVPDENPLAVAARLLDDPPDDAEGTDVVVNVSGPSPGRLRLAVLDGYRPEGWHQLDELAITGTHLASSPSAPRRADLAAADSLLRLVDRPATTGLRAWPTAGTPVDVSDAQDLRYSPDAGILVPVSPRAGVEYLTAADGAAPGGVVALPPAGVAAALYECPESPEIDDVVSALITGSMTPAQRLDSIGSWLKLTKLYYPQGLGGQTIGSVERFLSQDYARGNLEVFVTTFAVLARCADVPVRVVVGYPAPAGDASTAYEPSEITAWVETPVAGVGWVAYDPVPTPQEQRRQAELAAAPPPPPIDEPLDGQEPDQPLTVPPSRVAPGIDWLRIAMLALAGASVLVASAAAWSVLAGRRTRRRRSRVADPGNASVLAWTTLVERLHDIGIELGSHLTAGETAKATAGRVPAPVTRMMSQLAMIVDHARFDGDHSTDEDAGLAWALADESLARLPHGWSTVAGRVRHPRRTRARSRLTRNLPRRRQRWTAEVPATAVLLDSGAIPEVAGYEVESRIGVGSTSAVYRGRHLTSGRAVAVKVFSVDVGNRDFDHQRFVWEARVAEMVSGRPNLPEVLGSGFTTSGHPFLVTKLYKNGTLRRRVHVGGPLSIADVATAGRQLALALGALHDNGILHGDVKPENVFIDDDDSMVLGDLGAAWLRADGGPSGAMTPAYAAPEVWLGHAPTVVSDIYSLGLTLMFASTGRPPTPGSPPDEATIVAAFGSDIALPLLEVDPRRRVRSAVAAARRLGADVEEYTLVGSADSFHLPSPTWAAGGSTTDTS